MWGLWAKSTRHATKINGQQHRLLRCNRMTKWSIVIGFDKLKVMDSNRNLSALCRQAFSGFGLCQG